MWFCYEYFLFKFGVDTPTSVSISCPVMCRMMNCDCRLFFEIVINLVGNLLLLFYPFLIYSYVMIVPMMYGNDEEQRLSVT